MLQTETTSKGAQARSAGNGHGPGAESAMIRVAITDRQALVRSGIERLLEDLDDIEVVATSSTLEDAVRHLRGHHPDVLIYDPTGDEQPEIGSEAMAALAEASEQTYVIIIGPDGDPDMARNALRCGAAAYVGKVEDADALAEAVRRAARGEPYISGRLAIDIARLELAEEADGLTGRETEILRLIALGHTNAEIAKMLFLSIRTVESHRAHILEKLRLDSRAELVQYAIDRRLIP